MLIPEISLPHPLGDQPSSIVPRPAAWRRKSFARQPPASRVRGSRSLRAVGVCALLAIVATFSPHTIRAESNPAETPLQSLDITVKPGEVVGQEQVIRYAIQSGTNQFIFNLPPEVRSERVNNAGLVLQSTDSRFCLSFRILQAVAADSAAAATEARKAAALEHFTNTRDLEDFGLTIADRPAQGIQFRHTQPTVGDRLVKIIWVPCAAGVLEFTLNADATKLNLANAALDGVLLTFRSNESGKLEVVRRAENS